MGLSIEELDQMEEGQVMDILAEASNDAVADEIYSEVATQEDFNRF